MLRHTYMDLAALGPYCHDLKPIFSSGALTITERLLCPSFAYFLIDNWKTHGNQSYFCCVLSDFELWPTSGFGHGDNSYSCRSFQLFCSHYFGCHPTPLYLKATYKGGYNFYGCQKLMYEENITNIFFPVLQYRNVTSFWQSYGLRMKVAHLYAL